MALSETTPKHYLYGAILFSVMILGIVSILSSLNEAEGGNIANDERFAEFNSTFNIYDQIDNGTQNVRSSIENAPESQFGIFGVLNSLINTAWQTLKGLFNSFKFVTVAIGGLSTMFGVPVWVTGAVSLLIIVMIAFSIWSAIFQKNF